MDAANDIHKEILPIWAAFICGYPKRNTAHMGTYSIN
jgi:hypothetical protein